jgi:hypothetical protein
MIALAIIVLCIFPLLYPHAALARAQREFLHKIHLDHAVSLVFADIYHDLLNNKISWDAIQNKTHFEIDPTLLNRYAGKKLPFNGYYYFEKEKQKPKSNDPQENYAYLFRLHFVFSPLNSKDKTPKKTEYIYKIFIFRDLRTNKTSETPPNNSEEEAEAFLYQKRNFRVLMRDCLI